MVAIGVIAPNAGAELGVTFPVYKTKGCYFRISPDDQAVSAVELEAFTTALAERVSWKRERK